MTSTINYVGTHPSIGTKSGLDLLHFGLLHHFTLFVLKTNLQQKQFECHDHIYNHTVASLGLTGYFIINF